VAVQVHNRQRRAELHSSSREASQVSTAREVSSLLTLLRRLQAQEESAEAEAGRVCRVAASLQDLPRLAGEI